MANMKWEEPELHMDTKGELEGLHIYITQDGEEDQGADGRKPHSRSMSIHVDRAGARHIRDEISRRLFGGPEYGGKNQNYTWVIKEKWSNGTKKEKER